MTKFCLENLFFVLFFRSIFVFQLSVNKLYTVGKLIFLALKWCIFFPLTLNIFWEKKHFLAIADFARFSCGCEGRKKSSKEAFLYLNSQVKKQGKQIKQALRFLYCNLDCLSLMMPSPFLVCISTENRKVRSIWQLPVRFLRFKYLSVQIIAERTRSG